MAHAACIMILPMENVEWPMANGEWNFWANAKHLLFIFLLHNFRQLNLPKILVTYSTISFATQLIPNRKSLDRN